MSCTSPIQGFYVFQNGKRRFQACGYYQELFKLGRKPELGSPEMSAVSCGQCQSCRLKSSREWAVRCMHELQMHEFVGSFLTLTFDEENLVRECPAGSISVKHMQDFHKRLRKRFSDRKIRMIYCGEYGDKRGRPHYHGVYFGLDFDDKIQVSESAGFPIYSSEILSKLWTFGNAMIGTVTFESCAYVARYCTKKLTGKKGKEAYEAKGLVPPFAKYSNQPGIGADWVDSFGDTDCFSHDHVVVRGRGPCKPPRYYDKLLERKDPERFAEVKLMRKEKAFERADQNTHEMLSMRAKYQEQAFTKLIRTLE